MKKIRSNQASISTKSCTEFSKIEFFPMSIVNKTGYNVDNRNVFVIFIKFDDDQ